MLADLCVNCWVVDEADIVEIVTYVVSLTVNIFCLWGRVLWNGSFHPYTPTVGWAQCPIHVDCVILFVTINQFES